MMKNNYFWSLLFCFCCLSWTSCSDDDTPVQPTEEEREDHATVCVVFPPNGPGDNGYVDKVMNAAMKYSVKNPGVLRILVPNDNETALGMLYMVNALAQYDVPNDNLLAIFVGSEYKEILYQAEPPRENLRMVLMEDDGVGAPEWLHTCRIARYGASYLTGAMVAQQSASIVAAMPDDLSLKASIEGFKKGYESADGVSLDAIYYLADDYKGFDMQYEARVLCDSISKANTDRYHTIYPVAGASNVGVYNSLKDELTVQAIGMDNDYSVISSLIPFSINIGIDRLVMDYLELWSKEAELPKKRVEGLGSDYISFVFNEDWNSSWSFDDWVDNTEGKQSTIEFWKERYNLFIDEAIKEEKAYETH